MSTQLIHEAAERVARRTHKADSEYHDRTNRYSAYASIGIGVLQLVVLVLGLVGTFNANGTLNVDAPTPLDDSADGEVYTILVLGILTALLPVFVWFGIYVGKARGVVDASLSEVDMVREIMAPSAPTAHHGRTWTNFLQLLWSLGAVEVVAASLAIAGRLSRPLYLVAVSVAIPAAIVVGLLTMCVRSCCFEWLREENGAMNVKSE